MKRKLLRLFFKLFPPNFINEIRREIQILNPSCELVYYGLYSDGCKATGMITSEGLYFQGWGGPKHGDHLSFFPNDKPVYEWGISGLKYGDKVPKEIIQELREIIFYGVGATLKYPKTFFKQCLYTKDEVYKRPYSHL